ncbi:MAG: sigma-70 family RNA polymerase sigma factor [Streptosporangiales bacterium]|nr:sigma-70 family RNA polymerase sigma factor [Streptosporangiales bacterium]
MTITTDTSTPRVRQPDTASLVAAAQDGDHQAWRTLVDRYARLVWSITRDFRISDSDAADVAQTTWLRLFEHIHRIDPERVAPWLATTARRECLRVLAQRKRMLLTYEDDSFTEIADGSAAVDESLLSHERAQAVRRAMAGLPERWQQLLHLSMADPPVPYAEISATLDMPIGSIGPLRARSLAKLRKLLDY